MTSIEEANKRTHDQIKRDLEDISPLALPQYLMECEFYDMEDTQKIIDEAVAEFENKGGVAGSLIDPVLTATTQSVCLILLKKFHRPSYKKVLKGKLHLGNIIKQAISFEYPKTVINASGPFEDVLTNDILHNQLRSLDSGIDRKYIRKQWDNEKTKKAFRNKQFGDNTAKDDVLGTMTYKNRTDSGGKTTTIATTDHIIPLKAKHYEFAGFIRRYSAQETVNKLMNEEQNYQLLNTSDNSRKGDRSADEFIKLREEIEKYRPDNEKKVVRLKEKLKNEDLPEKERQKVEKDLKNTINKLELKPLTKEQQIKLREDEKKEKHRQNVALAKGGIKTVGFEQIGKIVETVIGPVAFEIKDFINNGMTHGFDTNDFLEGLLKRMVRCISYIADQLPKLLFNFFADIGQMLTHLALSIFGILKSSLGKFLDIVVHGLSLIKEALKILLSSDDKSQVEKGDAICKLLVAFATSILGQFLVDLGLNALGLPDPFSEIVAAIVSAIISTVVVHFYDQIDLFNIKYEVRNQHIKEILEEKKKKIQRDTATFDLVVYQKLKHERIMTEDLKVLMDTAIASNDFDKVNHVVNQIGDYFKVEIPYKTSSEFVEFVRSNEQIIIGN